ncbi:MAG: ubiquinone/menaquinone biosynthesis C-methylase UbiE [Halieaceae bacterium]|jgi:ubiquinone/menaquinone biosynthesis C-methylase UbiE
MPAPLQHDLYIRGTREQVAKQDFVASLRKYVLNDVANEMRGRYETQIEPAMKAAGTTPASGPDVHKAIKPDPLFRLYSSIRYNTQEMVWRSVLRPLAENRARLGEKVEEQTSAETLGSLSLNPELEIPRNVTAVDVHLTPGSYHREDPQAPWMAGALYDHGFSVFSFGMMGENHDDIGHSMSQYIRHSFPEFQPQTILDVGCTIGHNTCAWKQSYPDARVVGIDVAPACLRYAHARAESQGRAVDFEQANATALPYDDNSVDVVFSSMFLHELSVKDIRKFFAEAHRVLRPGGLMLHMELPPNDALDPYDAFYLDWDAYYNNEPFYKAFRDQNFTVLREEAGFSADKHLQFITPQYSMLSEDEYAEAIKQEQGFSDKTGRFADGMQWFGFGAWK